MNLFITSADPYEAAQYIVNLDKRRARKSILEFVQSAACLSHRFNTSIPLKKDGQPYGKKYPPKAWNEWLSHGGNLKWAISHVCAIALFLSEGHGALINGHANNIEKIEELLDFLDDCTTPFINYAYSKDKGLDYRHLQTFEAYKQYLNKQLTNS